MVRIGRESQVTSGPEDGGNSQRTRDSARFDDSRTDVEAGGAHGTLGAEVDTPSAGMSGKARHGVFVAAGLLATTAQVLLLRELVVDVAGDEAAIGVGLAAWLAGIAAGAAVARRRGPASSPRDASRGLTALALLPALSIVLGRVLRYVLCANAGELPGLPLTVGLALATLLPAGAAVGWVFTALASAASRLWRAGEAVARLYVSESLGSIAGGLLVTLLAGPVLPLRLAAMLAALASLLVLLSRRSGLVDPRHPLSAALLASVLLVAGARPLDALAERVRFAAAAPGVPLIAATDTPYQHLVVGGGEVRHLYASGQYTGSFPDPYWAESQGHLVALLAPRVDRVLLLGGSERGLVPVLLRHPVARLTVVEPDPDALSFLGPQLPPADRAALRDPRVLLAHDDPRRYLSRAEAGPFDLVLLLGPDPSTLLRARLATVEFFRLVASRLGPDGVLVVSLPTAPTVLTGETEALAGVLVRSIREALPVVHAIPSSDALAVAGLRSSAVTLDPTVLARRWTERRVSSPSFDAALLPVLLPPDRVAEHEARLDAAARRAPASSDDRPISFLHALARRQQIVSNARGGAIGLALSVPLPLLVTLAFVPSLLATFRMLGRRTPGERAAGLAAHAVAVTGAAGLGWSLLVLFAFQTHAGALYGQLGALVALFMLGLAIGGAAVGVAAARFFSRTSRHGAGPSAATGHGRRLLRLALGAAFAYGVLLPAALLSAARIPRAGPFALLLAYGLLLLLAGVVTGTVFPAAAELRIAHGDPAGVAAGRLETADHVGAALAALTGAVFFVPLLGLTRSAVLLAALLAVPLVMALRVPAEQARSS